jgi:hypothetical protein
VDERSSRVDLVIVAVACHGSTRFSRGLGMRTTRCGWSDTRPT